MKHAFAWLMAIALIIPQSSTAEGTKMTKDEQNVLAAIQTMTTAFQDKRLADVMTSYESAATVLFEPGLQISDRSKIENAFEEMAAIEPVFDYPAGHEVVVNGDIAIHIAPWHMTGRLPDGQGIEESGLSIAVLRRQNDGSWKMMIDNPHGGHLLEQ